MARRSTTRSTINLRLGQRYALNKVVAGVQAATEDGLNQVLDILSIPPERTGVQYPSLPNVSSAAGEAPAPQSTDLFGGTSLEPARVEGSRVIGKVASRMPYALALEEGTDNIEPRPFVGRLRTEPERRRRLLAIFTIRARRA